MKIDLLKMAHPKQKTVEAKLENLKHTRGFIESYKQLS